MRHYITILFLLLLTKLTYGQTRTIKETLLFSTDKSELTSGHISALDQLLNTLKLIENFSIVVSGHTDSEGEPEHNIDLSERRASSVAEYFVQKEISKNKITKSFFGETKPVSSNDTDQGKQDNRRVDILINIQTTQITQDTLPVEKSTIWEFYQQTEIELQEFCVNTTRDTALRCEQGSIIYIKANGFEGNKSSIGSRCVTIQVKEAFLKSDMILENLSTTSNGQIIESQGMIYINAELDGEPVSLIPGKDIVIMIPADTIISKAGIFDGNRNPHDSIMNWTVNSHIVLSDFTLSQLEQYRNFMPDSFETCPFFFCKITLFFRKIFGSEEDAESQGDLFIADEETIKALTELFQEYGIDAPSSLVEAANHPLYKKFKVDNFVDLIKALEEEIVKNIELDYKNKRIDFEDFMYYVFNTSRLGWSNVDVFVDLEPNQLTTLTVNIQPDVNIDVKLVFKNRNFILPASDEQGKYIFKGVPKGEEVWIVAVKYHNGKPYLSMTEVTIEEKEYDVEFVQLTLTELQEELKKLDRE